MENSMKNQNFDHVLVLGVEVAESSSVSPFGRQIQDVFLTIRCDDLEGLWMYRVLFPVQRCVCLHRSDLYRSLIQAYLCEIHQS